MGREGDEDRLPAAGAPARRDARTCGENVEEAVADQRKLLDRFNEISAAFAEPDADFDKLLDEQAQVQERIDTLDLWNLDNKIEIAMDALRLPPDDADVTKLSGGEKRRVALCRILLEQPDMLLLDEPTNHLDAESVDWLEHFLDDFPGTVVAITHDRYFLDNVAKWILELDRGKGIRTRGTTPVVARAEARAAQAGGEDRVGAPAHACSASSSGCAWPRARGRRRARRASRSSRSCRSRTRATRCSRTRSPFRHRRGSATTSSSRRALKKAYGDKVLFDDLTFSLPRGGIVGVIGPNGAGKTTLFRMIVGEEKPDGGELKVGETVQLAYVDQGRVLDGSKTAYQEVSERARRDQVGNREINARAYLSPVQLPGDGSAEEGRRSFRRRAQPAASGEAAEVGRQRAAARRADERSRRRYAAGAGGGAASTLRGARWSSRTIGGSSIALRRTSSRSRGIRRWCGSRGTSRSTMPICSRRKGADADQPHRVTYKKLVRS